MFRFSLIVPLLGETSQFENTLASVLRHRSDGCQIIVPHEESYEDPYGLSGEVDFVPIASVPTAGRRGSTSNAANKLVLMFNAAMGQARGEFVGLLRPGVQIEEDWDQPIESAFADPNVGSVSPLLLASRTASRLVTAGVLASGTYNRKLSGADCRLNSRQFKKLAPAGPTSWAGFYRRTLLTSLGDFDATLDSKYFDLDLALSLAELNFHCTFCRDCIVTIEEPNCVIEETRAAHGRAAQRALARFTTFTPAQRRRQLVTAAITELALAPWRPANLGHAFQRLSASRFLTSDLHHRDLLTLLQKQRERLLRPVLQLHGGEPSVDSRSKANRAFLGTLTSRRAA